MSEIDPEDMNHVAALQALLESTADYARRITGQPPTPTDASDALHALPPYLEPDAKTGLGLWDIGTLSRLVGFADLLRGWPRPDVAHIGLLAVHGEWQGRGLGRCLHDEVIDFVARWGEIRRLRLGIVATNAEVAQPFWHALGYRPTGETSPYESGAVTSTTAIWERDL